MAITLAYVEQRLMQIEQKLFHAVLSLGHDRDTARKHAAFLTTRLASRDVKLYGNRPIHLLHAAKRIYRVMVKNAILQAPARKAVVAQMRKSYSDMIAEHRKTHHDAIFFSFETAYAKVLKEDYARYRHILQC